MKVIVDDRGVEVEPGAAVLGTTAAHRIPLPQPCKESDRQRLGACRTCLVHVEGVRGTPTACHLPARESMSVSTTHPEAARGRTTILDLTRSMLKHVRAARRRRVMLSGPKTADAIRRASLCGLGQAGPLEWWRLPTRSVAISAAVACGGLRSRAN